MEISDLYNLPTDDKLKIVAELWDNIADSNAPIEISPVVIDEIERRRAELRSDASSGIDRVEMWRRVNDTRSNRSTDECS